jgi:hypothetical protein
VSGSLPVARSSPTFRLTMALSRLRIVGAAVLALIGVHFLLATTSPYYRQRTKLVHWTKGAYYDPNEESYVKTYAPAVNETDPGRRANAVFVVLARNAEVSNSSAEMPFFLASSILCVYISSSTPTALFQVWGILESLRSV